VEVLEAETLLISQVIVPNLGEEEEVLQVSVTLLLVEMVVVPYSVLEVEQVGEVLNPTWMVVLVADGVVIPLVVVEFLGMRLLAVVQLVLAGLALTVILAVVMGEVVVLVVLVLLLLAVQEVILAVVEEEVGQNKLLLAVEQEVVAQEVK